MKKETKNSLRAQREWKRPRESIGEWESDRTKVECKSKKKQKVRQKKIITSQVEYTTKKVTKQITKDNHNLTQFMKKRR